MKSTGKKINALIDKAVFDYNLIEENDRILIGASGGKDSTLLLEYFLNRIRRLSGSNVNPYEKHFEFTALHIKTEFENIPEDFYTLAGKWKMPLEICEINVAERLKPGRKMNCWWCSTQRRKELLDYAIKNGYNKIALGHHLDDMLETLIMNSVEQAELSTMPVKLKYDKFPVTVIRPLCYVSEQMIIEHAEESLWKKYTCTCDFQDNSGRKDARKKLAVLTDNDYAKKMRLFESLRNIQTQYLP